MQTRELNMRSPLRILDKETHGGLAEGQLGVVIAKAGVGKTSMLVQIGLDHLFRDHQVLHLAAGHTVDHLQTWYDALFDDLANINDLDRREDVRVGVHGRSVIHTWGGGEISPARVEKALDLYTKHQGFKPRAIIVEDYDWGRHKTPELRSELEAFKKFAGGVGAELWLAAHYEGPDSMPNAIPAPCAEVEELIDVALYLEPEKDHVNISLLKEHGEANPHATGLELCGDTLRAVSEGAHTVTLPRRAYTLLSGGAEGSESTFGQLAEEYGLAEVTYSFAGRTCARTRGLVELTDAELEEGHVTEHYIEAQLHRDFPKTPKFQKLLQTIWHQVITAGQVFVVGQILEDKTVKGGTGWAAELGRHLHKPVFVFDQEKSGWFTWAAGAWQPAEAPRIGRTRFCGTGTRYINDAGKAAIRSLFERSFT